MGKAGGRAYLVATDGSPASDKAVEHAVARAKESGVPLLIAIAIEGNLRASQAGRKGSQLDSEVNREARAKVDKAVAVAQSAGVEAKGEVVEISPPDTAAETITKFAGDKRVSQIFVGSHGRTGLMGQLLGSTADQVVKLAHCHVTVVR